MTLLSSLFALVKLSMTWILCRLRSETPCLGRTWNGLRYKHCDWFRCVLGVDYRHWSLAVYTLIACADWLRPETLIAWYPISEDQSKIDEYDWTCMADPYWLISFEGLWLVEKACRPLAWYTLMTSFPWNGSMPILQKKLSACYKKRLMLFTWNKLINTMCYVSLTQYLTLVNYKSCDVGIFPSLRVDTRYGGKIDQTWIILVYHENVCLIIPWRAKMGPIHHLYFLFRI